MAPFAAFSWNAMSWSLLPSATASSSHAHRFCCGSRLPVYACQDQTSSPSGDSLRTLNVIAAPLTAGADVLFPGGSRAITLNDANSVNVISHVVELEPPEFAYLPVDAWGEPCEVGTVATIDDLEVRPLETFTKFVCSGLYRFRVVELSPDGNTATVEIFHDSQPKEEDRKTLEDLELDLVNQLKDILRLSVKVSGSDIEEHRKKSLLDSLKRMDAFGVDPEDVFQGDEISTDEIAATEKKLLRHWILGLTPDQRREVLSFIVLDLLSLSFMERRNLLMSTDTIERLRLSQQIIEPLLKELAAKGAIISALGNDPQQFERDRKDFDSTS